MKTNLYEKVYEIVRLIPSGKVLSYGDIALILGNKRLSRVVGYALSCCTNKSVPCHRVVNRFGMLAPGFTKQGFLLEKEGIPVIHNQINIDQYRWKDWKYLSNS